MILTKITPKTGISYFNLKESRAYKILTDKGMTKEQALVFSKEDVEPLIINYISFTQSSVEDLEKIKDPTDEQKAELVRLKKNLQYLINYEYTK